MINNYFNEVVVTIGKQQEYFPGTGGNVSFKSEDGKMLIKASGKRVFNMNEKDGVVTLMYTTIKDFFYEIGFSEEGEQKSLDVVSQSVVEGSEGRPSIETGFHALLSPATIHSHSVYVNMLACTSSFEKLVDSLFFGSGISYLYIAYAKPGYYLTHLFLDKVKRLSSRPKVIFMKNHGIVVTASSMEDAITLHERVNARIKEYFGFTKDCYPKSYVLEYDDHSFRSGTVFLTQFIRDNMYIFEHINNYILFPDLTVFCEDITLGEVKNGSGKIYIQKTTGEVIYNTSKKEAECIDENLIAFAFLMKYITEHNLKPVYISQKEADSIKAMEQEKYRKSLIR